MHRTNQFTRSEFRSIAITTFVVVIGILLPPYANKLTADLTPPPVVVFETSPEKAIHEDSIPTAPAGNKPPANVERVTKYSAPVVHQKVSIDINSADSIEWKSLYGIGNVLSKRIVKFRDKLGGFHSVEQVGETYGLKPEVFESISSQLVIKTPHSQIVASRETTVEQLGHHPYFSWDQARAITRMCKFTEDTLSIDDLYTEFDSAWVATVSPYLIFAE